MATYIGSKRVSSGGSNLTPSEKKIYARTPQSKQENNSSKNSSSSSKVYKRDGKTYVTNSRGKEIELTTKSERATPEAATVLKDTKNPATKTVKVDYGKYRTRTEVTQEEYNAYKQNPEKYYETYRKPKPTQQTIRTVRQAPEGTKGIKQWSPETQKNIRRTQEEIKRTRPYAENIGVARMTRVIKKEPEGKPIPFKVQDPITRVLVPTIAYQTTIQVQPRKPQYSQLNKANAQKLKTTQQKRFERTAENYEFNIKPKIKKINKFWVDEPANKITQTKSPFTYIISGITKTEVPKNIPYEERGAIGRTSEELTSVALMANPIPMGTFISDVGIKGYIGGLAIGTKEYKKDMIKEFTIDAPIRASKVYTKPSTYILAGFGGFLETSAKLKLPEKLPDNIKLKTDSYYKTRDVTSTPSLKGSRTKTGGVKETEILKRDTNLIIEKNKVVNNKPVVSVTRGIKGDVTFTQVTVKGKTYTTISRSGNVIKAPKVSVTKLVGDNLVTKTTRFTKGKLKSSTTISKPIATKTVAEISVSKGENVNVLKGSKGELKEVSGTKNVKVQERRLSLFRKQVIKTAETTKSTKDTTLKASMTDYSKGQKLRLYNKLGNEKQFQNIFYSKSKKAKLEFGQLEPPKDFQNVQVRQSKSPSGNVQIENVMFEKQRGSRLISETKYNRDTSGITIIKNEFSFKPIEDFNVNRLKIKGKKAQILTFEPKTELFKEEVLKVGSEPKFKPKRSKLKSEVKLFETVKPSSKFFPILLSPNMNQQNVLINENLNINQKSENEFITKTTIKSINIFDLRNKVITSTKVDVKQDYTTKLITSQKTFNPFVTNYYGFKPNIPGPTPTPPTIPGFGGWLPGIGKGYSTNKNVFKKIGKQNKKYTPGAWESALEIKGKKSGVFTGIGLRPIAVK